MRKLLWQNESFCSGKSLLIQVSKSLEEEIKLMEIIFIGAVFSYVVRSSLGTI